jgi:tRNA(fMet)-specific endonuclease VapC
VFVLDTNTIIHYFKGKGQVAERLLAKPPREVALPSVVVYELEVGILKSPDADKRREAFDGFVQHVTVLPFARKEASAAARIRTALEAEGTPIGPLDVLIAGTALAHGATLVTRNVREFARIGGLQLENWYD